MPRNFQDKVQHADFQDRNLCIACESPRLRVLDRGTFGQEPHLTMILTSPWGTSPLPYLQDCEWVLVQCKDCKQIFHQRILTEEWQERRFQEWMTGDAIRRFEDSIGISTPEAQFSAAVGNVERLLILERLTRNLRKGEVLRVLDFGCGWGTFVELATIFGCEATGVDRSTARRAGTLSGIRIFKHLEEYRTSGEPPVHAITMIQVLEHLDSPSTILKELHGFLVPSGILILEVPNANGVRNLRHKRDLIVDGIDHINAFTPSSLRDIVTRAGFARVRPGVAQVTADFKRIVKREARRFVEVFGRTTTHQFFRKI